MRGLEGYGARIAAGCMLWIGHFAGDYAAWQVVMGPGYLLPKRSPSQDLVLLHISLASCISARLRLASAEASFVYILYISYTVCLLC